MTRGDASAGKARRIADGSSARTRRANCLADIDATADRTRRLDRATALIRATIHRAPDDVHQETVNALVNAAVDLNERKLHEGRTVNRDDGRPNQWSIRRWDTRSAEVRHSHYLRRIDTATDRPRRLVAAVDYLRAAGHDASDGLLDQVVAELVAMADRINDRMGVPA